MTATTTTWVKVSRRLGMDGNPMRRRADKIEAWLLPVAVAVFLALCPVAALGMSAWAHADNAAAQRAKHSWHAVTAVLLRAAPGPAESDGGANTWMVWTQARWTDGEVQRTGAVLVPAKSPAGSTHTVWLNRAGAVEVPPASPSQVAGVADTATSVALTVLAVLLAGLTWLIRRALDRRRLARWESAWLTVGPRWSHRG
ncbi:MAG TPA: hypothetical protein VMA73_27120 [Streptosporangiaceae bacterium]|nr:hypothetical protein [Streptosporangiaceae bacterium]